MPAGIDEAALANAFRATMNDGDRELAGRTIDQKILQAMVARSAADTLQWMESRVPNGVPAGGPLERLLPALEKGNTVGGSLALAKDRLTAEAKKLVTAAFVGGTGPVWVGAVVALLGGLFGHMQEAGAAVGAVLVPALVGGGAIVGAVVRGVATLGPSVANAVGSAGTTLWDSTDAIGAGAHRVFTSTALPAMKAAGVPTPASDPILAQLRGAAKLIVGSAFVVLLLCAAFFFTGLLNAYDAYSGGGASQ